MNLCSVCKTRERRPGDQRTCHVCHAEANRAYRARLRQTLAEAREIVAARDAAQSAPVEA